MCRLATVCEKGIMKPPSLAPCPCLAKHGARVAHKEVFKACLAQRKRPCPWDADYDARVNSSCQTSNPKAWDKRGTSAKDAPLLQIDIAAVTEKWDKSCATTHELIPRVRERVSRRREPDENRKNLWKTKRELHIRPSIKHHSTLYSG